MSRLYNFEGLLLPSITTVLTATKTHEELELDEQSKRYVSDDRMDEILAEACERGTHIHGQFEKYLKHKTPITFSRGYGIATSEEGIRKIQIELDYYKVLKCEEPLISEKYGYGGTADLIASDLAGMNVVIDFKTSKQNYNWNQALHKGIQLAANAILYENSFGAHINRFIIYQLNIKTKHKGFNIYEFDWDLQMELRAEWFKRLSQFQQTALGKELAERNLAKALTT